MQIVVYSSQIKYQYFHRQYYFIHQLCIIARSNQFPCLLNNRRRSEIIFHGLTRRARVNSSFSFNCLAKGRREIYYYQRSIFCTATTTKASAFSAKLHSPESMAEQSFGNRNWRMNKEGGIRAILSIHSRSILFLFFLLLVYPSVVDCASIHKTKIDREYSCRQRECNTTTVRSSVLVNGPIKYRLINDDDDDNNGGTSELSTSDC